MSSRVHPPRRRVELLHDGELIEAESGETLAHALIAADRLAFSRSPKLHRPRGPYCFRAACEGCLVRVDGMPNVMACRHRVIGGESVETQNVLGGRTLDLLQAADFIFPHGMDHHRIFAGIPGVSGLVTSLARRIAGLGRLPDRHVPTRVMEARTVDVLVIGGGRTGLSAAQRLGSRSLLVDDGLELGGALRLLDVVRSERLRGSAKDAGVELESETTALGLYREPDPGGRLAALIAGPSGAQIVYPRAVVLATGAHDVLPAFFDHDVPGVFSARAGLELCRGGISPGKRLGLVGSGRFAEVLQAELGSRLVLRIADSSRVDRVLGRQRVSALAFRNERGDPEKLSLDAVFFDAPETPAVELLLQAGGQVSFDADRGYVPKLGSDGSGAPAIWCAGRITGCADSEATSAFRVAEGVLATLDSSQAPTV